MYRELFEEVGLEANDVLILGKTKNWLKYDLPKKYQRKTNNQLCLGQKQIWFLLRLTSSDKCIILNKSNRPEFDDWQWTSPNKPLEVVIDFKKNVYTQALKELLPILDN